MKQVILLALLILIGGAFLRFFNLNSLPVFADESIYVRWSQVMRVESTLRFLPLSDGKQPLFMWTVIPFLKFISDPLIAGRAVSALCGLLTVIGVGMAAFILFKNYRLALFAAAIWAVLPYALFFERMALADGMLVMFMIWTFVFAWLALQRLRLDLAMLAGFTLGFAWLTKFPAIFAYFLIPLTLFFSGWWTRPLKARLLAVGLVLVTFFISFAMYNILRLGPEFYMIGIRNRDYVWPLSEIIKHPLDPLLPHIKDALTFYLYLTTPLGLLLALLGLADGELKHVRARIVLAAWWLIPVLGQAFIAKVFTARYLLFTVPFAVILMAHGLWHFGDRTKKHFLGMILFGLLVFLCLVSDGLLIVNPAKAVLPENERSGYLEDWTAGTGLRQVSDYLHGLPANTHILVGSEGYFGTPFSALQMYLNDRPGVRVIGVGLDIRSVDPKLKNALVDNRVYLVVNSNRFMGSPDNLGLELINSYPKAAHPDGSRDYLLFFKVRQTLP